MVGNNDFFTQVSNLEKDMVRFKTSQSTGAGNTLGYIADTGNPLDLNLASSTNGTSFYGAYGAMQTTFTSDTKPVTFTQFYFDITVNDEPLYKGIENNLPFTIHDIGISETQISSDNNIAKYQTSRYWQVGVNIGVRLKVKVYSYSLTTGKLTVENELSGTIIP